MNNLTWILHNMANWQDLDVCWPPWFPQILCKSWYRFDSPKLHQTRFSRTYFVRPSSKKSPHLAMWRLGYCKVLHCFKKSSNLVKLHFTNSWQCLLQELKISFVCQSFFWFPKSVLASSTPWTFFYIIFCAWTMSKSIFLIK